MNKVISAFSRNFNLAEKGCDVFKLMIHHSQMDSQLDCRSHHRGSRFHHGRLVAVNSILTFGDHKQDGHQKCVCPLLHMFAVPHSHERCTWKTEHKGLLDLNKDGKK